MFDDFMINLFFLLMLGSIIKVSVSCGYDLLVFFQNLDSDWYVEFEDFYKVDGIILLGYGDYCFYEGKLIQLQE